MTDISEVKAGDKIRATHSESGDVVEGIVTEIDTAWVETENFAFPRDGETWTIEFLERPLPIELGLYAPAGTDGPFNRYLALTKEGWFWFDYTHDYTSGGLEPASPEEVQRHLPLLPLHIKPHN